MAEITSNPSIDKLKYQVVCPVELSLRLLGGKWRGSILYQLKDGGLRFNELKFRVQDAVVEPRDAENFLSNKVLSGHLRELIEFELVQKDNLDETTALYSLTSKGQSVIPILIDLFYWGETQY